MSSNKHSDITNSLRTLKCGVDKRKLQYSSSLAYTRKKNFQGTKQMQLWSSGVWLFRSRFEKVEIKEKFLTLCRIGQWMNEWKVLFLSQKLIYNYIPFI